MVLTENVMLTAPQASTETFKPLHVQPFAQQPLLCLPTAQLETVWQCVRLTSSDIQFNENA